MHTIEAIFTRRSVRKYSDRQVDKETVETLLLAATKAPSAMNSQPLSFAIIQDATRLHKLSDQAKSFLLSIIDQYPPLAKYRTVLAKPDYNIFYNAPTLIIVYAKPGSPHPLEDCSLAAQNLMLSAHALGLGTCWIGFATALLNQTAMKTELGVPDTYSAVAPIIVGYPADNLPPTEKKTPEIVYWK